ncbi:unnamed protein product [Cochlearia groenlandica]
MRGQNSQNQVNNNATRGERHDDRWERSFKLEIPEFRWERNFKLEIPNGFHMIDVFRLSPFNFEIEQQHGGLKTKTHEVEVRDTKLQLVASFVGGLRQHIQHTLNLFRPLTISEAHQQALTVEAQSKIPFGNWNSTRSGRVNFSPHTAGANETSVKQDTTVAPLDAIYDDGDDGEVIEELSPDSGPLLMLRRFCLAPKIEEKIHREIICFVLDAPLTARYALLSSILEVARM